MTEEFHDWLLLGAAFKPICLHGVVERVLRSTTFSYKHIGVCLVSGPEDTIRKYFLLVARGSFLLHHVLTGVRCRAERSPRKRGKFATCSRLCGIASSCSVRFLTSPLQSCCRKPRGGILSVLPVKARGFNTAYTAVYYTWGVPRRRGDAKHVLGPGSPPAPPLPAHAGAAGRLPAARPLRHALPWGPGGAQPGGCTRASAAEVLATKQPPSSGVWAGEVRRGVRSRWARSRPSSVERVVLRRKVSPRCERAATCAPSVSSTVSGIYISLEIALLCLKCIQACPATPSPQKQTTSLFPPKTLPNLPQNHPSRQNPP